MEFLQQACTQSNFAVLRTWLPVHGLFLVALGVHRHRRTCSHCLSHARCRYDLEVTRSKDGGVAQGHVTNYAQNENGDVWNLAQLAQHMGQQAFQAMMQKIKRSTALVFCAALPRAKEVGRAGAERGLGSTTVLRSPCCRA